MAFQYPLKWEIGCFSELHLKFFSDKSVVHVGIRTPDYPAFSVVPTLTDLPRQIVVVTTLKKGRSQ